jgi:hypothetical protein
VLWDAQSLAKTREETTQEETKEEEEGETEEHGRKKR